MKRQLILASQSPRRKELLELAELTFISHASDIDETLDSLKPLRDELRRLALNKARAAEKDYPGCIVLGADTTVVMDDVILGKPKDREDAKRMLKSLSGRTHEVMTSCAICCGEHELTWINTAEVEFYELNDTLIDWYIDTNEPMDKAGAYGIQGKGALLVKGIHGDFYTVMGLPIADTVRKLSEFEKELE
ncbi:MAG: septum formation protein Maf [Erysipelotrichaceae bacterium]|nr:septum formation protein Maf [Erysipelotrichaceae bacterium]MBQ7889870.1 septum formation protein Maf [Erysipelotrichaceae bacterium]